MNLEDILIRYGLTLEQSKLFLTCSELGSASVYKISKAAKLPRSSCYEMIEKLKEKGLVTSFHKKNIKYYLAEDPRVVIDRTKELAELFEKALPELNAIYNSKKDKPAVRFYEGVDGMKGILKEMLKEAKDLSVIGSVEDYFSAFDEYLAEFLEKRLKRKIPIRTILKESPKAFERKKLGIGQLRQAKIMPAKYRHNGLNVLWENKIAMFSFRDEMRCIVVESREMAMVQKTIFQLAWDSLPE